MFTENSAVEELNRRFLHSPAGLHRTPHLSRHRNLVKVVPRDRYGLAFIPTMSDGGHFPKNDSIARRRCAAALVRSVTPEAEALKRSARLFEDFGFNEVCCARRQDTRSESSSAADWTTFKSMPRRLVTL